MKGRIIIAGGSGFLGQALAKHFRASERAVVILTRTPKPAATGVREIAWDGQRVGPWARELEGAEAVINLAGRSVNCRYHQRNRRIILESRLHPTRVLGEAISRCATPPRVWLNSSTATIYRHTYGPAWDESGEIGGTPEARDEFSVEVATAWERAFDEARTPNTRKLAMRSAMVLGHGQNSVFPMLRRLVRLGLGGRMVSGRQFVSWIHQEDFCRAIDWLFADWERVLMIHFEVDADALQPDVPFELDLRDGRAYVSLVAFTMRGMRPRLGGKLAAWMVRPIATHDFLNVRTYVRHGAETGIYFMAEWLSNQLAVKLGPATFGLPYRHGKISYHHEWRDGGLRGRVTDAATGDALAYRANLVPPTNAEACPEPAGCRRSQWWMPSPMSFAPCPTGSLTGWLMERYTAFTCRREKRRFFRVWHPPWPQCEADVGVGDLSLVKRHWPWFGCARLIGANFSPGLRDVWMGRPWSAEVKPPFGQADHDGIPFN